MVGEVIETPAGNSVLTVMFIAFELIVAGPETHLALDVYWQVIISPFDGVKIKSWLLDPTLLPFSFQ